MFKANVEPRVSRGYYGTKHLQSIVNRPTLITTSQQIAYPVTGQLWNLSPIDSAFAHEVLKHGNLPFIPLPTLTTSKHY